MSRWRRFSRELGVEVYRLEKWREKALRAVNNQVGAIFAIDGRVAGCDVLCSPEIFATKYDSLLQSYALDALWRGEKGKEKSLTVAQAKRWLGGLKTSKVESFPSVGEGLDLRFEGKKLNAAALVWEDLIVHLSAFPA